MHDPTRLRWPWRAPLLLREHDEWGEVQITHSALGRELRFDGGALQGRINLQEPWVPLSEYAVTMSLAPALLHEALMSPSSSRERGARVGVLGLGTGNLAWAYQRALPKSSLTLIELRSAVIQAARKSLKLDHLERVTTVACSAEVALPRFDVGAFDLLAVDLFLSAGMAPPLMTEQLWRDLFRCLEPQGVACVNLWSSDPEGFQQVLELIRAYRGADRVTLGVTHLSFSNVILFVCRAPHLKAVVRRAARLDELLGARQKATRRLRKARREAGLSGERIQDRAERLTLM